MRGCIGLNGVETEAGYGKEGRWGGGAQVWRKDRVGSRWTGSVGFIVQLKAPNQ